MHGFEDWTIEDVQKHNAKIKNMTSKIDFDIQDNKLNVENKKSKYRANKVEIDGIKFDSQKERRLLFRVEVKISSWRYKRILQTSRVYTSSEFKI